jgi:hypothetical protein
VLWDLLLAKIARRKRGTARIGLSSTMTLRISAKWKMIDQESKHCTYVKEEIRATLSRLRVKSING